MMARDLWSEATKQVYYCSGSFVGAPSTPLVALPALQLWLLGQAVLWLVVAALYASDVPYRSGAGFGNAVGLMAAGSYALLWGVLRVGRRPADWVTGGRFVILLVCFAGAWQGDDLGWGLWLGAGLALAADLLDGWVARKFGGSDAGAILDMETDQLAIVLLAILAIRFGGLQPWILGLPLLRPLYVLVASLRRLPAHDPKPVDGDNSRGRRIAALVMVAVFVAAGPEVIPLRFKEGLAALALVALVWSFWSDFAYLLRRRVSAR